MPPEGEPKVSLTQRPAGAGCRTGIRESGRARAIGETKPAFAH